MSLNTVAQPHRLNTLISKVPGVTLLFWIIKVLCTTIGETAADYLNTSLKLGLSGTTLVMGVLLAAALAWQFRLPRYLPGVYWTAVVLISVVGTLITDNLTDHFGLSLWASTGIFAALLALIFAAWQASEQTLSIHSIRTLRREMFYWTAVLLTFALGTAAGDLVAEKLALGYWKSALIFAALIGLVALAHFALRLNAVTAFWAAYILTRPLGASVGDYLSQDRADGGLQLGTLNTSATFLVLILAVIVYLSLSHTDQIVLGETG